MFKGILLLSWRGGGRGAGGMDFLGAARGCELVAAVPAPPALLVTFNATRVKIPDTLFGILGVLKESRLFYELLQTICTLPY